MRIISGKYKGRVLHPPANLPVRPTTDFAKTGLFNILENQIDFENLNCLDLFSGTGSISIELISRGAKSVTSVDRDYGCTAFQKETTRLLEIHNLRIIRTDVLTFIKKKHDPFDLIFADPPFDLKIHESLTSTIVAGNLLAKDGRFILEHNSKQDWSSLPGFQSNRTYGNVGFSFFSKLEP